MDVESQTALSVYMTKQEKKKIKNRLDYRVAEVAQRRQGPLLKSLDWDEMFKPSYTLFCCDIDIWSQFMHFLEDSGQTKCFFGSRAVILALDERLPTSVTLLN